MRVTIKPAPTPERKWYKFSELNGMSGLFTMKILSEFTVYLPPIGIRAGVIVLSGPGAPYLHNPLDQHDSFSPIDGKIDVVLNG